MEAMAEIISKLIKENDALKKENDDLKKEVVNLRAQQGIEDHVQELSLQHRGKVAEILLDEYQRPIDEQAVRRSVHYDPLLRIRQQDVSNDNNREEFVDIVAMNDEEMDKWMEDSLKRLG